MTRQFNSQFHCPNCKTWHTSETLFGRWIRNNDQLDSAKGFCVTDQDYWVHRFKTHGNRAFQCLMLVEIKTHGADLTLAQTDTLHIVNQVMRNRRATPTKDLKFQAGIAPLKVRSSMAGHLVTLKSFGMHVLTFSGLGPEDSEWIRWDRQEISEGQLTSLLRFDLDPDSLQPLDLRSHHQTHENKVQPLPLLPDTA